MRGDMLDVFRLAKLQNKKVFVVISDSNCGKCNKFFNFLDQQKPTVKRLQNEYVCYKVDINNKNEKAFAELVKCPSYPFPYFFDNSGNLLAFGYPNSKNYDISNLDNIGISNFRFAELFQLNCTINDYKLSISQCLKGTFLFRMNKFFEAFSLFKNSLEKIIYPYNLRYTNDLIKKAHVINYSINDKVSQYKPSVSDTFLYGDCFPYIYNNANAPTTLKAIKNQSFKLDSKIKNLGVLKVGNRYFFQFSIVNQSKTPLIIYKVSHPCDCIKLFWTKKPLGYNETSTIKGEFIPYATGEFSKEIFIHSNSINQSMDIIKIVGTVNK
ncbi:DUF1573 domain-containing protein [Pedobacter sp. D749]|uniref:DUF1573 domain-containing protein n=1 Tax=Pedobacter sp. D749 TaxID=2856523 RepID=UPI001C5832D0|nr:DUF1573 domain-containing protein [Pedobacter sp. D749]QXU39894.1 DUF1573 domain-containing protein [Pedobacter sp. D749]